MNRAVQIKAFLGPEKYMEAAELVEKPKPKPGPGEVLVRMRVRPLNPADVFSLMGVYPGFQPLAFPATPGLEGYGVVEEAGEGACLYRAGDRVVPLLFLRPAGEGSWQEYVAVREDELARVPEGVSDEAAAQLVVNPVTAVGMLKVLNIPKGDYLLQTAAGSVLGRMLITLAKHYGIKTINVVRRSAQIAELKAIGADEVICSAEEDIAERVKEITGGRGAYGAVECIAGEMMGKVAAAVRNNGTVLLYGAMGAFSFEASVGDLLFRGVALTGFWLSPYVHGLAAEERAALFAEVMGLLEEKVIEPYCGERVDLSDFKEALKKQGVEGRGGKILLVG